MQIQQVNVGPEVDTRTTIPSFRQCTKVTTTVVRPQHENMNQPFSCFSVSQDGAQLRSQIQELAFLEITFVLSELF